MKRLLIILCAIFALSAGTEFYVAAQPAEGIKITANHVSAVIAQDGNQVYVEIINFSNNSVSVSWSLTLYGSVVDSGTNTIAPHDTFKSTKLTMVASLADYKLEWNCN